MNCERFRQFIDAFVGGERDVVKNPAALEHFDTCERCAVEVAAIRQLKRGLARVFAEDVAPAVVRDHVWDAIRAERAPTPIPFKRRHRWVVPLGMAAAVAFVSLVYPLVFDRPTAPGVGPSGRVQARWVSAVERRHNGCVAMGRAHHRASLPRDVGKIRVLLSKELGLQVLAPDLTAQGFRFHSADACGIGRTHGAHIVYQRISDGQLFSLFSVPRADHLVPDSGGSGLSREYSPGQTARGLGVLAWQGAATTYILCGNCNANELKTLADALG